MGTWGPNCVTPFAQVVWRTLNCLREGKEQEHWRWPEPMHNTSPANSLRMKTAVDNAVHAKPTPSCSTLMCTGASRFSKRMGRKRQLQNLTKVRGVRP